MRGLHTAGADPLDKPVREVMTEKVVSCVATDRAAGIMAVMISKHVRHVPLVEDGQLTEVQSEADAMRSYIAGGA